MREPEDRGGREHEQRDVPGAVLVRLRTGDDRRQDDDLPVDVAAEPLSLFSPTARAAARPPEQPSITLRADLGEPDQGDEIVLGHLAVVERAQEARHVLHAADLRIVVLDLVRESSPSRLTSTLSMTASKIFFRGENRGPARTETIIPFRYFADLSPSRIVADFRPLLSWFSTIGE